MTEKWAPIFGFEGEYEISSLGRVRSLDRRVPVKNGYSAKKKGKMLRTWICRNTGYLQVMLSDRKKRNVHRIVAETFVPGRRDGLQVNHKNGDRSDSYFENLEWVTPSENVAHGFRVNGRITPTRGVFGKDHPASKSVFSVCLSSGKVVRYGAAMDAVREGFSSASISRCCHGLNNSHKGRRWGFVTTAWEIENSIEVHCAEQE